MMTPKIRKKRIIKVKHPQLRRFRTVMREVLRTAVDSEVKRLNSMSKSVEDSDYDLWIEEKSKIARLVEGLVRARRGSPIGCRLCARHDLDLVFNPCNSQWYCEECYTFNQEGYKKDPHPYEPDWRKLFP